MTRSPYPILIIGLFATGSVSVQRANTIMVGDHVNALVFIKNVAIDQQLNNLHRSAFTF